MMPRMRGGALSATNALVIGESPPLTPKASARKMVSAKADSASPCRPTNTPDNARHPARAIRLPKRSVNNPITTAAMMVKPKPTDSMIATTFKPICKSASMLGTA